MISNKKTMLKNRFEPQFFVFLYEAVVFPKLAALFDFMGVIFYCHYLFIFPVVFRGFNPYQNLSVLRILQYS